MMRSLKQPAKVAMLLLLAVLLLSNGVGNVHGKTIHENSVDLHALLDFKKGITNDPQALSNWSTNTHFCRWNGVNCTTTRPFRVSSLTLTGQDLQGQISPSLGNLSFLTTLDLSMNSLIGSLPILGHLQKLQILYLNNNNLSGTIPDSLTNCSNLAKLDLSVNSLVGVIPPKLDLLSNLSYLDLSVNSLVGQIISSLGNLTFLSYLDLSMNNFVGPLPILGHLQQLQTLYLHDNRLNGIIPDSLTKCSSLANLDLSLNSLVGAIPQELDTLSNLAYLNFSRNSLVGLIPQKLGFLSYLSTLDLSQNSLVGQIPPKLGFLPSLEYINFESNRLEGRIPDELWKLPKLQSLLLDENRLSGELPHAILNLPALEYLSLGSNKLGKTLPPNIGKLLPILKGLSLQNNTFEGQIPASLGNALRLEQIDLSNNKFTGRIPASLGNLSNLTILNLELNHLEAREEKGWEFFNALTNCHSLKSLSLSSNKLQGSIPQSVGNLSRGLKQLLLAGNNLSGQVPWSIGKLSNLTQLALGANDFSGEIGGWIDSLKMLQSLDLGSNSFTGPIAAVANHTQLTYLFLQENKFEGMIPASLGNLPLSLLDLSYNNLQGYIPPNLGYLEELLLLNLSHNNFQGDILQISNLKQLTILDLSSNKLIGQIPDSLGQCYSLVTLQMNQNFLTGNIPVSFGNLSLLTMLNLSHNNLSGTIPTALNRLESLDNLDLSYNDLQGEIPGNGVLGNATAVSLEGNWGLCGGAMNLHMPPCPAVSRRSETEYYLVRALIPLFGFMSLVMLTYLIIAGKKTSRSTNLYLLSFGKKFPRVSYKDLNRATENFSEANLLGRGSYGSVVYRGNLTQAKIQVAIKVFDLEMKCAHKSFVTECDVLRNIRHRNLLPILTACSTIDNNGDAFKALIYEFMPNGNLDTWLHSKFAGGSSKCLSLAQRVSIAVGIADALAYLHHDCERQIVHCDLKPTNILLDDDMNAYLGDFGIASLVAHSNASVGLKGTIGYIAPEYAQSGLASISGDVYSFGIVLLEMLVGKRPTDPMFENELNLLSFVERNYPDQMLHIVDARLQGESKGYTQANITMENVVYGCLLSLMQVALSCTRLIPRERINIREVTTKLHSISTTYIRATKREQVMLP